MITKPIISVAFHEGADGFMAHVSITLDAVGDDPEELRDEVLTTIGELLTDGPYDINLLIPATIEEEEPQ